MSYLSMSKLFGILAAISLAWSFESGLTGAVILTTLFVGLTVHCLVKAL